MGLRETQPGRTCLTMILLMLTLLLSPPAESLAQGSDAAKPAADPAESPAIPIADAATMSVTEIAKCMRRNIVERGSLRAIDLTAMDREGRTRHLRMRLFWKLGKGSVEQRMTLQVVEPEQYAGSAYLVRTGSEGEEVYVYASGLGSVRRIKGQDTDQPLWGTDVTYAEIKQLQGLIEQDDMKRVADAQVFGRPTFVLETTRKREPTMHRKFRAYVDQATCTLLKSEILGADDTARKVLEADMSTLLDVDRLWLVLGYEMKDLEKKTRTRVDFSHVSLSESLPETLFSPEGFYKPELVPGP